MKNKQLINLPNYQVEFLEQRKKIKFISLNQSIREAIDLLIEKEKSTEEKIWIKKKENL